MATFKKVLSVLLAVVMAFSVFSVAASAVTTGGTDSLATLTLDTEKLTVDPGDEIVVTAYLTTNFYAASYTVPWFYSKNIFTPVSAVYADGSPYEGYAKLQFNANLNANLVKNQFGTKTLAWAANPVLAANNLTAADITKDNFQNYFYYATCTITPNSQIGPQAAIFDNNAIVDYTFKVADDAAPGTVGVIWFDQSYGWATTNTGGIFKIACYKDGAGQVGTSTTACYTDVSTDASRLVFTVAGTAEPEEPKAADYAAVEAAKAKIPADLSIYTDDTVATLNAAVAAVEEGLTADRQAEVDAWAAAIEAAITGLELKPVAADYSKVTAAIAKVPADLSIYTNGDAVTAAVNAVDYTLTDKDQATVDAYAAAIEAAIAALTLKAADYTAVEAAKAKVPADLTIYVNGDAVTAAVEAVVYGLDITKQAEVDAMAKAIEDAVAALTLKAADYTAVEAAKAKVPADLSIYVNGDAVAAAVAAVVYGLDITKQAEVDAYAAAIEAAIEALELKPADYTVVETAKAKIPADLTIYTDDTVATLNAAVAAVVEGLDITKQAEVNAYAAAIDTAVAGLTLKAADYTAVEAAKAKVPADLTIYVNGDAVAEAVAAVVEGLDITKQAEVDAYAAAIEAAIEALELKAADYAAVEAAKAKIPADLSIYDAEKVAALNAAVEAVVYGLDITKQAEVDAYAAAIEAAIAALDGAVLDADYTTVAKAKATVPADLTIYTDDTAAAVTAALNAVIYGLDVTHQEEVNAMAQAIVVAVANLKYKPADYSAVEAAKESIPADLSIYEEDAVATLNAAVEAVVYGLDITKQADVDDYAAAIVAAVAALADAVLPAEYGTVANAILSVPRDLSIYTDETVAAVNAAIEAVVYGLDITKQAEVDAMAQAIADATAALELKAADYTAVEAAKGKVPADLSIYTNGDAVTAAVEAVVEGLDITKQAEVDAMAQAIEDAIAALELKAADYTAVEAAKAKIPADLTLYTDETVAELNAAVEAVVYGLDITKQAEVDAFAVAIESAIEALDLKEVSEKPQYQMTEEKGRAGEEVEIYVSIQNNPGIISLRNSISYDTTALELVSVENLGLLNGFTNPSVTITSPYILRWSDALAIENNTANGDIVKLTFRIKDNAEVGVYEISVNPIESRNFNGEKIMFEGTTSTITVIDYILGDIDNDGEITDWDAIVFNRYLAGWNVEIEKFEAADIDKDGEITDWDAIILERYLSGWDIVLEK